MLYKHVLKVIVEISASATTIPTSVRLHAMQKH